MRLCAPSPISWWFFGGAIVARTGRAEALLDRYAEGSEAAASEGRVEHHPYRMTMVLERRDYRWLLRLVRGSSRQAPATPIGAGRSRPH
jgi:hypothetical protein